jgi:hypothetical protein
MQILKLLLPLAAVLMAGQALAHKAPRAVPGAPATVRLSPAQTDTSPAAMLDSIGGHVTQSAMPVSGPMLLGQPSKGQEAATHINRRH